MSSIGDKCGIFAVYNHPDALSLTYRGLLALQHRGQESAGIAWLEDGKIESFKGMGLVEQALFSSAAGKKLWSTKARISIGHTRYSTSGFSELKNAQPLVNKNIAVAHNGTMYGDMLPKDCNDTQGLLDLIESAEEPTLERKISNSLRKVQGAYCLEFLESPDKLIAVRDPYGFRPLVFGTIDDGFIVSSESCIFETNFFKDIGAKFLRDIFPGEMMTFQNGKYSSHSALPHHKKAQCIFEFIYVSHVSGKLFGVEDYTHTIRYKLGKKLGEKIRKLGIDADLVTSIPNSGRSAAHGVAVELGLPEDEAIVKNNYLGRGFIKPEQWRRAKVREMMTINRGVVSGKSVIVVDDSIVRGTTFKGLVKNIYDAGAEAAHGAISSPPYTNPCFYGINTPDQKDLFSFQMIEEYGPERAIEEMRKVLGLESLVMLSPRDLLDVIPGEYCTACFNGEYPTDVSQFDVTPTRNPLMLSAKKS